MNKRTTSALISLAFFGLLAGCGGGGGGGAAPPVPPPPAPPVVPMSAAGIWVGQAVTPDVMDIVTSFEFNDSNGFILGTAPFTADFQGGRAETRGAPALYTDGVFSWHVSVSVTSIVFGVPSDSVAFDTRTVAPGDVATIRVMDVGGMAISTTAVNNAFQRISVDRDPGMGESLIASVEITVTTGEIVIDSYTSGFPSTASTDDIACVLAPNDEFACVISDESTGALLGGANGTYSVNGDQLSGSGSLYAAPGETLADGSTVADLTISAGTVVEDTTLDVTIDSTGLSIVVTSLFDDIYDRGADLATVAFAYTPIDIFGEMSSFVIDANGVISGTTTSGCVLSGQASVIDAAANVYDVNVVADAVTCDAAFAGDYNGLGSSQDDTIMDDSFIFAVFVDGVSMIAAQALK